MSLIVVGSLFAGQAFAAEPIDPGRIIAAATGDWNKDGTRDLGLLVRPVADSDEDNAVYLFLTDPDTSQLALKSVIANKVWGDLEMAGRAPDITALPNGSLQIMSHNDSIGRNRWEQKLTIAYRNDDFAVAGYTYSSYDTLDPGNTAECDLNVLTGKGTSNGKAIAVEGQLVSLEDWSDDIGRDACGVE